MGGPVLLLLDELARVELALGLLRPERGGVSRKRGGACVTVGQFGARLVLLEVFDGGGRDEGGNRGGLLSGRATRGMEVVVAILFFFAVSAGRGEAIPLRLQGGGGGRLVDEKY